MAWLGGDGFDFHNTFADLLTNTDQWASGSQCVLVQGGAGGGRFGNSNYLIIGNQSVTAGALTSVTFANTTTIFVNFNMRQVQGTRLGFYLRDGSALQMGFYANVDRTFCITTGDHNATVLATSGVIAPAGTPWFHCQVKVVINNTTGSVELRINGNTAADWNPTLLNLRNGSANNFCNSIVLRSNQADGIYMDDVYWHDDQGAAPNTFMGDVRARYIVPASDSSTQWTRNTGSTNASAVDDGQSNDADTTYVSDGTAGHVDQYQLSDLPVTPDAIIAVQAKMSYRMDDAGPHQVKMRLHSGSVDDDGSVKTCSNSYQWTQKLYTVDPNTGVAWTLAGVNALLLGPVNVL